MAEYIDREQVVSTIEEVWNRKYAKCGFKPLGDCYRMLMKRLKNAPTANVVEVVRCGQCEFQDICKSIGEYKGKSGYCSKGKPKEGE